MYRNLLVATDASPHATRALEAAVRMSRAVAATSDPVARAIVQTAKRTRAALIVMASHGRGPVADLLPGSTTQKAPASCQIPLLVHR